MGFQIPAKPGQKEVRDRNFRGAVHAMGKHGTAGTRHSGFETGLVEGLKGLLNTGA